MQRCKPFYQVLLTPKTWTPRCLCFADANCRSRLLMTSIDEHVSWSLFGNLQSVVHDMRAPHDSDTAIDFGTIWGVTSCCTANTLLS
jgi:hypothetical protein